VTAELYQQLQHWQATTSAPVPTALNTKFNAKYLLDSDSYITWQQVQQMLKEDK